MIKTFVYVQVQWLFLTGHSACCEDDISIAERKWSFYKRLLRREDKPILPHGEEQPQSNTQRLSPMLDGFMDATLPMLASIHKLSISD